MPHGSRATVSAINLDCLVEEDGELPGKGSETTKANTIPPKAIAKISKAAFTRNFSGTVAMKNEGECAKGTKEKTARSCGSH